MSAPTYKELTTVSARLALNGEALAQTLNPRTAQVDYFITAGAYTRHYEYFSDVVNHLERLEGADHGERA